MECYEQQEYVWQGTGFTSLFYALTLFDGFLKEYASEDAHTLCLAPTPSGTMMDSMVRTIVDDSKLAAR